MEGPLYGGGVRCIEGSIVWRSGQYGVRGVHCMEGAVVWRDLLYGGVSSKFKFKGLGLLKLYTAGDSPETFDIFSARIYS